MDLIEYARLANREKTYWWHIGRLKIIESYLRQAKNNSGDVKILNVGCGTGGTIATLESYGKTDNVDISDEAIKFMSSNGHRGVVKVDGIELPFDSKTYDIVGAFDVLEHIDEQVDALMEWKRVIKDSGAIVITVPAYQWLWSGHDIALHHKRRYTVKRLAEAGKKAGLRPYKISYAIAFSTPLIIGFRLSAKLLRQKIGPETSYVDVPIWMNSLFSRLLVLEAKLHKFINLPFGTSVIVIFKKA